MASLILPYLGHIRHRSADEWVLGASDPEMAVIRAILTEHRERYQFAVTDTGEPVRPGDAYKARLSRIPPPGSTLVLVECDVQDSKEGYEIVRIDHHRPGDPGYGQPPEKYLEASSVGQVVHRLHALGRLNRPLQDVLEDIKFAAAADHCLAAAYQGKCPGVDPDELMTWRAETRASFQRRSVGEVLADVDRARSALRVAESIELAPGVRAKDMRGKDYPELPEAAAREGVCFLAALKERDGSIKVVCQAGSPEQIRAFMNCWAVKQGLERVYGDPERGFAGGYLRHST